MKIATVQAGSETMHGVVVDDTLVDLRDSYADSVAILEAVSGGSGDEVVAAMTSSPRIDLASVAFLPPVLALKRILCVGTNYAEHVAESPSVTEAPDHPMIFTRFASSLVGHGQPLVRPPESEAFDYEGELAIVIGRTTRRATRENALDAVGGYSCFMDGSIRDWQRHTKQFTPGKNYDKSGSWGPWITTADEVGDPYALHLRSLVDGEEMQSAATTQLIFDLEAILVYCSTFTTLEPGDVIATGTPGGVGFARTPPVFLAPGREITVDIPGVGRLTNSVIDEE